jgi:4-diphosphocytidyl-2C-methyl-D-erythritol kinase
MVRALKERLRAAGATAAVMSGSGSAVVGVAPNPAAAAEIAATLGREDPALRVHAVAAPVG